jgi:hypothetical protein
MGTRSLTIVRDEQGNEIVNMYRQFDGCPNGHGSELLERFANTRLTNGFSPTDTDTVANGMECLAAQVVGHFKSQMTPGGIYLYPAGLRDCGEEYIYELYSSKGESTLNLKVTHTFGDGSVIYDGTLAEFDPEAAQENMERVWEKSRGVAGFTDDEVIAAIQGGLETAKEKGVTLDAEQEAFIEDPEQDADVKRMRDFSQMSSWTDKTDG